jgi:hypothetical protein
MPRDDLGLTKKQSATIRQLDAEGWRLSVLTTPIGADSRFHAYRDGENRWLEIDDEGIATWHETAFPG